jgi:hypothetical protein
MKILLNVECGGVVARLNDTHMFSSMYASRWSAEGDKSEVFGLGSVTL